jgi:hypothetical protein
MLALYVGSSLAFFLYSFGMLALVAPELVLGYPGECARFAAEVRRAAAAGEIAAIASAAGTLFARTAAVGLVGFASWRMLRLALRKTAGAWRARAAAGDGAGSLPALTGPPRST